MCIDYLKYVEYLGNFRYEICVFELIFFVTQLHDKL